jgi:hypothetical protein
MAVSGSSSHEPTVPAGVKEGTFVFGVLVFAVAVVDLFGALLAFLGI